MSAATETAPELAAAILNGDTDAIHGALNGGADINARNGAGLTPLQFAVLKSTAEAVYVLLERGAAIEAKAANATGGTALHMAAHKKNAVLVELLLDKGAADPDSTDAQTRTPLHLAAEAGARAICQKLIEAGAKVTAEDSNHQTPRQLAAAQTGDDHAAAALYLQTVERNRGLDRTFEQACRNKVTADITELKARHPERFKIKTAKEPANEPAPTVPHKLTLKL